MTTIDTSFAQSRGGGFDTGDTVLVSPIPAPPTRTINTDNQFHNQYIIARESPAKAKRAKTQAVKPDRPLVDGSQSVMSQLWSESLQ